MKVIFAFNKMNYHYKPMNDNFIRLAKLSVNSAKKYYKTKFYGDKESHQMFLKNNILFHEYEIIEKEKIREYYNIYSISKIYAMMSETEPYILMDFDVVLFEKLESRHSITYGQPEVIIKDTIDFNEFNWIYESYVNPFNKHIKKYYENELEDFRWTVYPSFCVMMVNNPLFVRSSYEDIFKRIPKETIHKITPTLLEQLLLHQYVVKYNVDFDFFMKYNYYNIDKNFHYLKMTSKKFVHININDENIEKELEYLEKKL